MASYQVKLIDKYQAAKDTPAYRFERPEGFEFVAGQSVIAQVLRQAQDDIKTWHKMFPRETDAMRDMTIASAPSDDYVELVVRHGLSPYKQALAKLKPGDELKILGPKGQFVLPDDTTDPIVMIAGGIGITPFRSMIRYMVAKDLPYHLTVFYSNPTQEQIAFYREITAVKKSQQSKKYEFKIIYTLTEKIPAAWTGEAGRLNPNRLKKYVKEFSKTCFYICGPKQMVPDLKQAVLGLGVQEKNLKTEEFTGY